MLFGGKIMAITDNNSQNRGMGKWKISIYNPSCVLGPFEGCLVVNKDFYIVYRDEKMNACLFNVPSQNVAFAYNENIVKVLTDVQP
jgi:hypothetical protein